jgi:predicted N-acetyltransferase YhbS
MRGDDIDAADAVLRLAFGTIRGVPDPSTTFGDRDLVRTRYRAAPEHAWVAESGGDVVGSVFAARWGAFGFLGPLTVHPELWDRGVGSRLVQPVLDVFGEWGVRQAGLFTFSDSPKHLGLYQKHGFWPGSLTVIATKAVSSPAPSSYGLFSDAAGRDRDVVLDEARRLTDEVSAGLDLEAEIVAVDALGLGDTILLRGEEGLDGVAVCHVGGGTEAGSDTCYVKFAAARPGEGAPGRFEELLGACEAFTTASGSSRIVAGVDTGRLDAYRRLLARGFRAEQIGLSMWLRPEERRLDRADDYVIDDRR